MLSECQLLLIRGWAVGGPALDVLCGPHPSAQETLPLMQDGPQEKPVGCVSHHSWAGWFQLPTQLNSASEGVSGLF